MEDVYNLTTVRKPAKPRSRDLQDTNAPAIGGGAVMTVGGAAYMPDTATATNANHARTADTATSATSAQRAEKSATAEALQTANFNAGASGARVADDGSAEFETLTVRGFIKAAEYVINRIKITEGAQWLTEGGVIEKVVGTTPRGLVPFRSYDITMRERFAGDTQAPFVVGDILRGQYNNLQGGGDVQTSWMAVRKVEGRVVTVGLYQDRQVPGGANAQPIVQMRVARWGNASDTNPTRQSHIVLDPERGQIVRRMNVNAPIIDPKQVDGFSLGTLPTWVQNALGGAVDENSNYLYARGIITQDIIRFSPQGKPIAERVDRGVWSAQQPYYHEGKNATTGIYEISRVWLDGTLYELAPRGDGSKQPSANEPNWIVVQEKPRNGEDGQDGKNGADGLTPMPNLLRNADLNPKSVSNDSEHNEGFAWRAEAANGGIIRHEPNVTAPHAGAKVISCESFNRSTSEEARECYASLFQEANVVEGVTYTFSVYVKGANAGYMIAYPIDGTHFKISGANPIDEGNNTAEGWKRYAVTFTARSSGKTLIMVRSWSRSKDEAGGKVFFACPKLEESYQPTPWTRAQEDFRGAAMRPLGDWDALPDGFQFQSGGVGEDFIDTVSVKSEGALLWWSCKRSHAKTKDTRPNVNAPFWELGQNLKYVATDLLLAKKAFIENLGVRNVETRNAQGEVTFKAEENGDVFIGGKATIGDWFLSGGKIVSILKEDASKIGLDAKKAEIKVTAIDAVGEWQVGTADKIREVTINASRAIVEVKNPTTNDIAQISSKGIYVNNAETRTHASYVGFSRLQGAIVAVAQHQGINYDEYNGQRLPVRQGQYGIIGVYGSAYNDKGNVPTYGGYFENLHARGLSFSTKHIDRNESDEISETDTFVFCTSAVNGSNEVKMPKATRHGQTIILRTGSIGGHVNLSAAERQAFFWPGRSGDKTNTTCSIRANTMVYFTAMFFRYEIRSKVYEDGLWMITEVSVL